VVANRAAGISIAPARQSKESLGCRPAVFQGGRAVTILNVDPGSMRVRMARSKSVLESAWEYRWIICRRAGHGQDFARFRFGDDDRAPLGLGFGHGVFDLLLGDILDRGVERQDDVASRLRRGDLLGAVIRFLPSRMMICFPSFPLRAALKRSSTRPIPYCRRSLRRGHEAADPPRG